MGKILTILFLFSLSTQAISFETSGKLLLTGGVSQVEGSAGGGLSPWALIGGYGTKDEIGANAYYTKASVNDFSLESYGLLLGLYNRAELSLSKQVFNTEFFGPSLNLSSHFKIEQQTLGLKVRVIGDAVLDQSSWLPQISVGLQHKKNEEGEVVKGVGAEKDSGTDFYIAATKVFLNQSLLVNLTLRRTKANQLGILGFGGDENESETFHPEFSLGYLLDRNLLVGFEYRDKPNNLAVSDEDAWKDIFVAWTATKNISLTVAYLQLGKIATKENQEGLYTSLQLGF